MGVLRRVYQGVRGLAERAGYRLSISRVSPRNQPELVNRAIWRPFVLDDKWRALYKSAQTATNGHVTDNIYRQCRLYSTLQLAQYAAGLPAGDVIECGCWHGHSTIGIASLLAESGFSERFHVFDSFEGLSPFGAKDESFFALTDAEKRAQVSSFASSFDFVKSLTERFGFVELHRGWIPQSFEGFVPRALRFVHIDVDMYEPTQAALRYFWPHLVPGGCIVVDDYNHSVFEGATRALDEFLPSASARFVYRVPMGSAFLMK